MSIPVAENSEPDPGVREYLIQALRRFLNSRGWISSVIDPSHLEGTPERVVRMYEEMFAGVSVVPESVLSTIFDSRTDEMVTVYDIPFTSICAHHILPFYGRCHVAYIPNGRIIGLSKIPRLVEVLSRRPQVQELLCSQVADCIMDSKLAPHGVAVCMDAVHTCMACRGPRTYSVTRTTSLRGVFLSNPAACAEFMRAVRRLEI